MPSPGRFGITRKGEHLYHEVFGDETAETIINEIDPRPKKLFDYTHVDLRRAPATQADLIREYTRLTSVRSGHVM